MSKPDENKLKIWKPKSESNDAPRIHLEKICHTMWIDEAHTLLVAMDSGHTIRLPTKQGNDLLDAWHMYVDDNLA